MVGTRSKEGRMAMTGARTPSAIVPKEEQAGVDRMSQDGTPAEGRDLGAAAGLNDTDRAGKAQMARDDQPRTTGERQQHKRHSKYQPKGHKGAPRHQQHKQRTAPPRAAPEQLGTAASTGDMARTEKVQASPERVSQGLGKTQTAAQRKQERSRWCRPPRAAPEPQGASTDPDNGAGTEKRGGTVLSNPGQRAPRMDKKKMAALLEQEGIKGGQKSRVMAALLLMLESTNQPAPESESSVPTVAVGLLRAEKPKDVSQWRCKVPTCSESYHPLEQCQLFLQMSAQERGELVALSDLCRGCLTQGHGIKAQTCLFRNELKSLCAWPKCKEAHHQLLHVDGEQSRCPHQYLGGDAAAAKQRYAQAAAAVAHDAHQPPSQLMVQRIATKAKKSCLTLWDTGSQVSLTTHEAARGMRLEPIPGPPLNLKGVGDSQRTRSTVRYKIPLFDTGGRMKEVTAYGIDHIMAPIEAIDPKPMRAVFPEVPTGGLEAVSGRVDLLIGHDNFRLFPVEHKRVQNAMLARSHFGTGWIASGRPLGQGDPATSTEEATCTGEATRTTSTEEATCTGEATRTTSAEEATRTKEATSTGEASCTGAAAGTEKVTSKEAAVKKEEPAHIASMEKPAKPPDRLEEQFAITNVVLVQEQEELYMQEELDMQEEDLDSDEGPSDEDDWPMPDCMDWSRGYGAEGAECIPEQAGPPAGAYACIRVPEEQKTGQQARVAGIKEQLTSLLAQPQEKWLSTAPAARIGRLTTSGMSAGATAATSRDQAQGATGSGARYELQPSREKGSRGEPPLGGLWKGADETGQQEEHTRSCAASESAPECGATSAAHPDVPPGNPAAVATTQRQKEAREKAAAEQLPERGSPVGVQRALPQEGAASEAGAEQLLEQGGPVEVQLKLCQEGNWAEARRGQRIVGQRPGGGRKRVGQRPRRGQRRAGQRPGGGRRPRWKGPAAKQVVVMKGSRRVAGTATSAQQGLLHHGKSVRIFVGEVKDEGDEDDPQCEIRSQAGHPIPVGHENRRRRIWEPGKPHSERRQ